MKTKLISAIAFGAVFLAGGVLAQNATMTSSPATPAPAVAASATPTPNQVIYAPRLPSAGELASAAAAQGLTVQKIDQTSAQIIVVYQFANGQTNTVAYQLLPSASAPAVAAPTTPPPTVVYSPAPRVVYYDSYPPAYYPGYWYPPVSLNLGFGFRGGYGFRGGFGFRGHWR